MSYHLMHHYACVTNKIFTFSAEGLHSTLYFHTLQFRWKCVSLWVRVFFGPFCFSSLSWLYSWCWVQFFVLLLRQIHLMDVSNEVEYETMADGCAYIHTRIANINFCLLWTTRHEWKVEIEVNKADVKKRARWINTHTERLWLTMHCKQLSHLRASSLIRG